jgi:tripartite motif-containing protein 2/3/tripartite motif-containing protein 71
MNHSKSAPTQTHQPKTSSHPKDGTAYVCEYLNHRVQILNSHNVSAGFIGSRGKGANQFEYPEDVALNRDDCLYVVDSGNHRICKFDHKHEQVATLGGIGSEDGELRSPRTILIDKSSGVIYVSDSMNHRVQLFSSKHSWILSLGSKGTGKVIP